jgi:hypothetical protein
MGSVTTDGARCAGKLGSVTTDGKLMQDCDGNTLAVNKQKIFFAAQWT